MGIYYRWKAEPIGLDALGRLVLDLSARVQKKKDQSRTTERFWP